VRLEGLGQLKGQCGSEDVRMVRNSGLRQGPRDFGFMN
jgi:hypothetical protein